MSSSPPSPSDAPTRRDVEVFLSPFLGGGMVTSLLLGILVVLSVLYFVRFPHDPLLHRIIIISFLLASLLSWGTTLYLLDYAFIQNFGSAAVIHAWPRIVVIPILLPAVSALLSQILFGTRVWKFSQRNRWIGGMLVLLMGLSLAAGVLAIYVQPSGAKLGINGADARFFESLGVPGVQEAFDKTILAAEVFLWVSSFTDCFISGCLAYQLVRQRASQVLDQSVDTLLHRILIYGVMTGGFTALYSIAMAVTVLVTTNDNNMEIGLALQQTLIYAIVCISSLNLRPFAVPQARPAGGSGGSYTRPAPRVMTDRYELDRILRSGGQPGGSVRWPDDVVPVSQEKLDLLEKGMRIDTTDEKSSPRTPRSATTTSPISPPLPSYHSPTKPR